MTARWEVQIIRPQDGKLKRWDTYASRELAEVEAAKLRGHKMFAQVRRIDETPEAPEHNGDRRRFICWAVMCGFAKPDRLTESILAEVEREAAP